MKNVNQLWCPCGGHATNERYTLTLRKVSEVGVGVDYLVVGQSRLQVRELDEQNDEQNDEHPCLQGRV